MERFTANANGKLPRLFDIRDEGANWSSSSDPARSIPRSAWGIGCRHPRRYPLETGEQAVLVSEWRRAHKLISNECGTRRGGVWSGGGQLQRNLTGQCVIPELQAIYLALPGPSELAARRTTNDQYSVRFPATQTSLPL